MATKKILDRRPPDLDRNARIRQLIAKMKTLSEDEWDRAITKAATVCNLSPDIEQTL